MNRIAQLFRDYSFATFFLPFGIILIIVSSIIYNTFNVRKNYPKTEAVVTGSELYEEEYWDGDTHHDATYRVFVRYTVDGKEYEGEYGIFPEIKDGTTVKIDYNPEDPTDISQPTSIVLPIVLFAGGVAALIGSVFGILKMRKKNKALKQQEEEWKNGN